MSTASTPLLPPSMRALKVLSAGHAAVTTTPLPTLRPTYFLIKPHAVALNPADWKGIDYLFPIGSTVGVDYAGVVVAIGAGIKKSWSVGDRVFGAVHGCNAIELEDGSFGDFLVAKADVQVAIPENLSFEAASTMGAGVVSVGQGMYQIMGLPWPGEAAVSASSAEKRAVLIYGGSTATGALAIQFAKASGLEVITTCSPHNKAYVESLGASAVFDYHSQTCAQDIRIYAKGQLYYAFDCIGEDSSTQICHDALATDPAPDGSKPVYVSLVPRPVDASIARSGVRYGAVFGYTAKGEPFTFAGNTFPAKPEDKEFIEQWLEAARVLIADGTIKPHTYEVREGGLEGILDGLNEMREGRLSGKKLVYRIGEDA